MSIADILDKAADLIEPEGAWIKADYCDRSGDEGGIAGASCWCVTGAIAKVIGTDGPGGELWANEVLRPLLGLEPSVFVTDWNDAPERTQPEVVAKLREAAAQAREQGL